MIERYTRNEMKKIWSEENKFQQWMNIEILATEAWAKLGIVPQIALKNIKAKAKFDVKRINEIEEEVKHDVIAFLTCVSEKVGPDSRFIHYGMTSSDVLDTSLAILMKQAADILLADLKKLQSVFKTLAKKYQGTVMIGRSHGIHAEPTTFGLKMLLFYAEVTRNIERLEQAKKTISVGQISGPVGTFSNIDPFVEEYVCKKLDLTPAPVSTQVIQRDRHAEYLTTLAVIGSSLEKFATEIRGLQRTEILEAEEFFSKNQKGSSAMPHKRNPIICERICGLARILRGNSVAALENVALWHERDITHSSVERVIVPDSTILLDYMLAKTIDVFENLVVYPENMKKNLSMMRGLYFSQSIMLKLIDHGATREQAYKLVQRNAMKVWQNEKNDFCSLLKQDKEILSKIKAKEIENCFKLENLLKHEQKIYKRLGL